MLSSSSVEPLDKDLLNDLRNSFKGALTKDKLDVLVRFTSFLGFLLFLGLSDPLGMELIERLDPEVRLLSTGLLLSDATITTFSVCLWILAVDKKLWIKLSILVTVAWEK